MSKAEITVREMSEKDMDAVMYIETASFAVPWSRKSMEGELNNPMKLYYVALIGEKVIGYVGMWHVVTEGHITNIAIDPEYRRMGAGNALIKKIIETAEEKDMLGVTLEVRISNENAIGLYKKHGFVLSGIRKEYYEDNKEDAYIMWRYLIPVECID